MTFLLFVIGTEWIVVLVVAAILLLFGGSKLPQLAKALGQSKKAFREGLDEGEREASSSRKLDSVDDEALFEAIVAENPYMAAQFPELSFNQAVMKAIFNGVSVKRIEGLQARIRFADLPVLSAARHLAEQGYATGASDRNWANCEASVSLPNDAPVWHRTLLTDPQTSGGLLVACTREAASRVLSVFTQQGFAQAAVIGELAEGTPRITIA